MKNRYDPFSRFEENSDDKHEENTEATSSTEACMGTKESLKYEDLSKLEYNEELESLTDKLELLKSRVKSSKQEKQKLLLSERSLKLSLYESELELQHFQSYDSLSPILEKIHSCKKSLFERIQITLKQKLYLNELKSKLEEISKDLLKKESYLNSLSDSMKSLTLGFSRIKTYKSLDISTLKIDLDVIQYQMEERISRLSSPSAFNPENLKSFISKTAQGFKFWTKREYEKKIEEKNERAAEWEQKIAEVMINFELDKGKILENFAEQKDRIFGILKNKEESLKRRKSLVCLERKELEIKINESLNLEKNRRINFGVLDALRKKKKVWGR
jgi:hypothetical protein